MHPIYIPISDNPHVMICSAIGLLLVIPLFNLFYRLRGALWRFRNRERLAALYAEQNLQKETTVSFSPFLELPPVTETMEELIAKGEEQRRKILAAEGVQP